MKGNNKINFSKRVYEITKNISEGTIMSYKEVAKAAGSPKAWRAVGNVLHKNKNPQVPCHRVVRSDGRPGGYRAGRNKKIDLLKKEGAKVKT